MNPYRIVHVGTGTVAETVVTILANDARFNIEGFIPDPKARSEVVQRFEEKMRCLKINRVSVDMLSRCKPQLVLVNECRTWLKDKAWFDNLIVNIHSGILPRYRGLHANAWALLNGETELGYSLHQVIEDLDAGPIYHVEMISIGKSETYSEFKARMLENLYKKLTSILVKILAGDLEAKPQNIKDSNIRFCSTLRAKDGILSNLFYNSDYICSLFRIFSRPVGTGIHSYFNGQPIELAKIAVPEGAPRYVGIPGSVVRKLENGSVWIKSLDSIIAVEEIILNDQHRKAADVFRLGDRIGN